MLPAYFAGAFQNKKAIVGMTLIFALGVSTIILPIVLGATFLVRIINVQHSVIYVSGGILMFLLGIYVLFGGKISIPMPGRKAHNKVGPLGIYTLGVFSGVASSCCAPVLAGVIALSSFGSSFGLAVLLGISYVLGMVLPLLIISLLWGKYDWKKSRLFRSRSFQWKLGSFEWKISGTELATGTLLILMGAIAIWLGFAEDTMAPLTGWKADFALSLQRLGNTITESLSWIPNWLSAIIIIIIVLSGFLIIFKRSFGSKKGESNGGDENEKK
ncbi:cytochrome c biogenesis CcdA family protein [Radiobacillus sp. PE A8.2]|uniref:cytochrome c biogenesis CcdA family protein n=1 Tax=Radiobacillus sp. PE A8.2 TaxID=3380349 RepID=UPI003890A612